MQTNLFIWFYYLKLFHAVCFLCIKSSSILPISLFLTMMMQKPLRINPETEFFKDDSSFFKKIYAMPHFSYDYSNIAKKHTL